LVSVLDSEASLVNERRTDASRVEPLPALSTVIRCQSRRFSGLDCPERWRHHAPD
jgi:hypothetical protein